jgi:hypothetical protein
MPGGVFPMKGTRNTPAFVNLFSAFENSGTIAKKTGVSVTKVTAASKQIADAMIRSMLGSPVNTSATAQGSTGDTQLRSMLGLLSAMAPVTQTETPVNGASGFEDSPADASNTDAPVESEPAQAMVPELQNAPAPVAPRGSLEKMLGAPRTQNRGDAAQPLTAAVAQSAPVTVPQAASAAIPTLVVKPEASPVRTLNAATARGTDIPAAPARPLTIDSDTVERATEPAKNEPAKTSDAPLAFSMDLAPIAEKSAAAVQATAPAMDSHPIVSQSKTVDAQPASSEKEEARTVAPAKNESGNAAGHDDRSPERDSHDMLQTATVAQTASVRGEWTMNIGAVAVESRPDTTAGPAAESTATARPVTQLAEIDAPVTVKASGVAQEISVRISQPDSPVVDLHVTERGGEVHVTVRTPDVELQTSLRQDLGTLTNSLERAGYHAETFVPRATSAAQTNLRDDRQPQQGFSGRGGSQSESGSGKQKEQKEQRGASWLEELEQSK